MRGLRVESNLEAGDHPQVFLQVIGDWKEWKIDLPWRLKTKSHGPTSHPKWLPTAIPALRSHQALPHALTQPERLLGADHGLPSS
jgi:hypothetical protein